MPPKRKFHDAWLEQETLRDWLGRVDEDPRSAQCKVCKTVLVADINTIKKHGRSKAHSVQLRDCGTGDPEPDATGVPGPSSVGEPWPSGAAKAEPSGEGKAGPSGALSDGVANAERELEKFIAKHPLPPDATAHFIELLRTIIPDSDILKQCTFESIKIPKE